MRKSAVLLSVILVFSCLLSGCTSSSMGIAAGLAADDKSGGVENISSAAEIIDANIDMDGNLIIILGDGRTINAGNVKGEKGDPGPQGEKGEPGKDGMSGRDGVDGKDGLHGATGRDGADGADGRDGVDGRDGSDGRDGADGRDGIDGMAGAAGMPGERGPSGVDGLTPHIGGNGNWHIGDHDTGVKATGSAAADDLDEFVYDDTGKILLVYLGVSPTVNIPEGTVEIGERAFANIRNLRTVNFPQSARRIGENAFSGCENLEFINLNEGLERIEEAAFYSAKIGTLLLPSSLKEIGDFVFSQNKKLAAVDLGTGLEQIGFSAFAGTAITNLIIPASLERLGPNAFGNCASLFSVTLPNGLKEIGSGTFAGCSSLANITLPDGLEKIDHEAFASSALVSVVIPASVSTVGSRAFASAALRSAEFLSSTPPAMQTQIFTSSHPFVSMPTNIIVPVGSRGRYISECPEYELLYIEKGNQLPDYRLIAIAAHPFSYSSSSESASPVHVNVPQFSVLRVLGRTYDIYGNEFIKLEYDGFVGYLPIDSSSLVLLCGKDDIPIIDVNVRPWVRIGEGEYQIALGASVAVTELLSDWDGVEALEFFTSSNSNIASIVIEEGETFVKANQIGMTYIYAKDSTGVFQIFIINVLQQVSGFPEDDFDNENPISGLEIVGYDNTSPLYGRYYAEISDNDIIIYVNNSETQIKNMLSALFKDTSSQDYYQYSSAKDDISVRFKASGSDGVSFPAGTVISIYNPPGMEGVLLSKSSKYINAHGVPTHLIDQQNSFMLSLSGMARFILDSINDEGFEKPGFHTQYTQAEWNQLMGQEITNLSSEITFLFKIDIVFNNGKAVESASYNIYYQFAEH